MMTMMMEDTGVATSSTDIPSRMQCVEQLADLVQRLTAALRDSEARNATWSQRCDLKQEREQELVQEVAYLRQRLALLDTESDSMAQVRAQLRQTQDRLRASVARAEHAAQRWRLAERMCADLRSGHAMKASASRARYEERLLLAHDRLNSVREGKAAMERQWRAKERRLVQQVGQAQAAEREQGERVHETQQLVKALQLRNHKLQSDLEDVLLTQGTRRVPKVPPSRGVQPSATCVGDGADEVKVREATASGTVVGGVVAPDGDVGGDISGGGGDDAGDGDSDGDGVATTQTHGRTSAAPVFQSVLREWAPPSHARHRQSKHIRAKKRRTKKHRKTSSDRKTSRDRKKSKR